MRQQVEVTMTLWVDATLDKTAIEKFLFHRLGEEDQLKMGLVKIDRIREEAEIYGNEEEKI